MSNKTHPIKILLPLIITGIISALLLTISNKAGHDQIADNARMNQLRFLDEVMPLTYHNDLYNDVIEVTDPGYLGNENKVSIFRARDNNGPVGLVIMPVITKGYTDKIKLAIGIARDGTLLNVRVIEQKETEGLGDKIDQNRSDWINQFSDRSLTNPEKRAWTVKNEGGGFDQLSGATITSRSVVNAVRKTLEFYEINQDSLY